MTEHRDITERLRNARILDPGGVDLLPDPLCREAAAEIQRLRALVAKYEKRLEIDHAYEQIPKEERVARDPITGRLEWLRPRITTPEEREHMPDKILALEIGEVFLLELIRDAYNAVKDIHGFDPDLLECLRFHAWKADERDRSHAKEEDDEADPGKEPSEGA